MFFFSSDLIWHISASWVRRYRNPGFRNSRSMRTSSVLLNPALASRRRSFLMSGFDANQASSTGVSRYSTGLPCGFSLSAGSVPRISICRTVLGVIFNFSAISLRVIYFIRVFCRLSRDGNGPCSAQKSHSTPHAPGEIARSLHLNLPHLHKRINV